MDLDQPAIDDYWRSADAGMFAVFQRMEKSEHWAIDQQVALEARIVALGQVIERINPARCDASEREALSLLIAFCRSSRAFRVLAFLDQEAPGFSVGLLREAERRLNETEGSPGSAVAAQIHIDRYSYLHRFRLLGRIYSSERMEHLRQIIEEIA